MAQIKKNQLANIVFPMVDGTDFASVESGLTASDFESKVTKKYFGVTHGNSTAFTSGTISKTIQLVRSGIFQQTLKAAETNFDYVLYSFQPSNTSLAHQMLVFQPVDYDDSDLMSRLSDVGSDLLSYLTGMSGMMSDVQSALDSQFLIVTSNISDVDSQLLLNASVISDIQSALDSQFLIITSNLSDVESQVDLLTTSNYLSQVHSDLRSQISGITASIDASDISDIASRVWSEKYNVYSAVNSSFGSLMTQQLQGASNMLSNISLLISDVDSQLLVTHSLLSDVESQVDLLATSNYLSQVHSDLRSQIAGITASISASDISDIASAVWAEKYTDHSLASSFGSLFSDIYSRLALTQSNVSDIESALDSQFVWTSAFLSDMNSDLSSQIGGITATITASDMSDIASRVWATAEGTRVDSRILVIQSLVSDVDSQLLLNASVISDIQSALDSQFVYESATLSDMQSDLRSLISGITATVSASDISDIASAVWANTIGARVDSRILLIQSNVSDVESQVDLLTTSNYLSQVHSDLRSQIGGITASVSASDISDITSAVWGYPLTSKIVSLSASDLSDIRSAIAAGPAATVTASDISDIASAVWANVIGTRVDSRVLLTQSLVSDVDSQLNLNASVISDVQSALDSQFAYLSNAISDMNSDLSSQIGGITVSVTASDISDIASAVWAETQGARVDSRILVLQSLMSDVDSQLNVTNSTVSDIYSLLSDVESQVDLNASIVSDIQSALDSQYAAESNYLSQIYSDLDSAIGAVTVTLTQSDISDIASGVAAALGGTVTDSDISDIASAVWDYTSRTLTRFGSGAIEYTYTVTDDDTGLPVEGVEVTITTDVAGSNVVWHGSTDAFGVARDSDDNLPYLDAGTYQFWSQKAGYTFTNPDAEVVS